MKNDVDKGNNFIFTVFEKVISGIHALSVNCSLAKGYS